MSEKDFDANTLAMLESAIVSWNNLCIEKPRIAKKHFLKFRDVTRRLYHNTFFSDHIKGAIKRDAFLSLLTEADLYDVRLEKKFFVRTGIGETLFKNYEEVSELKAETHVGYNLSLKSDEQYEFQRFFRIEDDKMWFIHVKFGEIQVECDTDTKEAVMNMVEQILYQEDK